MPFLLKGPMWGVDNGPMAAYPLVCPETKQPLTEMTEAEAEAVIGPLVARVGGERPAVGPTPTVLVRDDGACAYPVVDGVPVLLVPEQLRSAAAGPVAVDVTAPPYAEAYEEMDAYTAAADDSSAALEKSSLLTRLLRIQALPERRRLAFPEPGALWVDATYETAAQLDAYRHLAPVAGHRVLQLGGKGHHAVTLLLAGAAEAWVISPMVSELMHARVLARRLGVESRLRCAAGLAEELPLADGSLDAIYTVSTHHTVTSLSYPECARVLVPGGRFAAVEPWRAPLYRIGTTVLGKRDPQVHCKPMTHERVAPLATAFSASSVRHHGTLLRYPMLALWKMGVDWKVETTYKVAKVDDALASAVGLRRAGSCAALLARRAG